MHAVDRADASGAASPMLLQVLYETADRHPRRPALIFGSQELTWAELVEATERLARGLAARGIREGDRVALVHPNAPEFVVTFFAVTALGAAIVPLNPQYQAEELLYYFGHCDVRAVIADAARITTCRTALAGRDDALVVATGAAAGDTVSFQSLVDGHAAGPLSSPAAATDAVYQYSSGSTGRPKRVARAHEQCRWEAANFVETTGVGPEDRIFCAIPLFHTHGQGNCLLAAAYSGAALVILEDANPFIVKRQRAL